MTEGYVVDARPAKGGLKLVFEGGREEFVRTTFPVYFVLDNPYPLLEHPAVEGFEEEYWFAPPDYKRRVKVYRVELNDLSYYEDLVRRAKERLRAVHVNVYPSVMTQTLLRLNAYPMHRVSVEGGKVRLLEEEGSLSMPELKIATLERYTWYGPSERGERYRLYLNGEEVDSGPVKDFEFDEFVDIAECIGETCEAFTRATVKVDLSKAFLRAKGLMEWSKLSKTLLREIRYSTIGKVVTTNAAIKAMRRKYLIPEVKVNVEKAKTLEQLARADKGGIILIPRPGCYDSVFQVDFSSFYPSIIVKYNISPETIDECDDLETEIGHSLCFRRKGVVPEALEEVIERKERLKRVDEERAEAVKWVLVASFGYLGYRHSRFGRIEAYELVTYFARKNLREAMKIIEENGGRVIHAIVDSVFYQGREDLSQVIAERLGFRAKAERFSWVLFTESQGYGVPTRYLARYRDGRVKVKGLLRKNLPQGVRKALEGMIAELSRAETCEEARSIASELLRERATLRGWEPQDFVIRVKEKALIRGTTGFYDADLGFSGADLDYYRGYLERWKKILLSPFFVSAKSPQP